MANTEWTLAPKAVTNVTNVELLLLGPPELHVRGRRVDLGPKRLAALAYLALNGNSRRRALAELLWPDSDNPLNNLAVARNDLSRLLGPDGLEVDAQTIGLGPAMQVDVHQWQSGDLSSLERWTLYRGTFLQDLRITDWANGLGSEFEQWLLESREQFASEHRGLALELGLASLRRSDFVASLGFLQVAHAGDEPREDATRWYVLALGATGQENLAVTAFASLQNKLRDELEVDPSTATREALQMAREDAEGCQTRIRLELAQKTVAPAPTGKPNSIPLVGREMELQILRQHLEHPKPGLTVIVRGEAGVGKTRLLQTLYAEVQSHWRVFSLEFGDGQAPLAALERAVRNLVAGNLEQAKSLPSLSRVALARFVPNLILEEAPPGDPELERVAAFSAIRTLLEPFGPLILHLEDVQWADRQSLEFVQYLRSNLPSGQFVQLVTWRDTDADQTNPGKHLEAAMATWLRAASEILALSGLNESGIQVLVDHFQQSEVNVSQLLQLTGGNPLYVTEWLSKDFATEVGPVQPSLANLIRSRLSAIAPTARQMLEALAVLGADATLGLLQRTSGRSPEETAFELDALRVAQLIQVLASNLETGVRFNHDLIRDVIVQDLSTARSALLHVRAARASSTEPLRAASHFWLGRELTSDDERAVVRGTYISAGVQLGLRGEIGEAMLWYERALGMSDGTNERVWVMTNQARTLERFAHYDEASQLLERFDPLLDLVEPVTAATANNIRSDLVIDRYGDVAAGLEYANAALKILEVVSSVAAQFERGRARHLLGWCAFRNRDYLAAETQFRAAMAIHDSVGNQSDLASSMVGLGVSRMYAKKVGVKEIFDDAISLAKVSNNQNAYAYGLNYLGNYFRREGRLPEALASLTAAINTRRGFGGAFLNGSWLSNLGLVYLELNNPGKALECYEQALESRDVKENTHYLRVVVLGNVAEACLRLKKFKQARLTLAEAITLTRDGKAPTLQADSYWWLGELEVLENNPLAARKAYEMALEISKGHNYPERVSTTRSRLARLLNDANLAKKSLTSGKSVDAQTAVYFTAGQFSEAKQTILESGDRFELIRLELDVARITEDSSLEEEALSKLPL